MSGYVTSPQSSGAMFTSPIKLFGIAKTKITDIFADISSYAKESSDLFKGLFNLYVFTVFTIL